MVATNPETILADQYLQRFLNRLHPNGESFEIRLLFRAPEKSPHHKVFDSVALASDWVRDQEQGFGEAIRGVFVTLNPVKPTGRTSSGATKADDIFSRKWLLVDVDPVRPSKTNSTSTEKAAAKKLSLTVADFLEQQQWPKPLRIDSGKGFHLLFRLSGFP